MRPVFLLTLIPILLWSDVPYEVHFQGARDREMLEVLRSASQLVSLKDTPPASAVSLKRRIEADLPNLTLGLQSLGYYEPTLTPSIDTSVSPAQVTIAVNPGPIYTLKEFSVVFSEPFMDIPPSVLGITLGKPIRPREILQAESVLLELLDNRGYPLATIEEREVIANAEADALSVIIHINAGPLAYFGPTTVCGNEQVATSHILGKIRWCEGAPYNPCLVDATQLAIEDSALFGNVTIITGEEVDEEGYLPITIEVAERKHHTIGFGISYNTQRGPGFTAEWENRNLWGFGRKIALRTDLWIVNQRGLISYVEPDLFCPGQDFIWLAEVERDRTEGFTESYLSLSTLLNRKCSPCFEYSWGVTFKELKAVNLPEEDVRNNQQKIFPLIKLPFHWRWTYVDDLLNPIRGKTALLSVVPTVHAGNDYFAYCIHELTLTGYVPLSSDERCILAGKMYAGTILGQTRRNIPAPERFYAGSESTLRGYRYRTVSPLSTDGQDPLGGLSLLIGTVELRKQWNDWIGSVLFYDIGNVYGPAYPQIDSTILHSIGFGLRYYTAVGPLRLDIAFPLKRRKDLDRMAEFYLSIGQSF